MGRTSIEWADKSLNFYTWSCNKVSEGCKNCYMMDRATRFNKPSPHGTPEWRNNAIKEYNNLKPGEVVFVNSMSDTYHPGVPESWIQRIHNLAAKRPDVIFLLLTKRPERLLDLSRVLEFPLNLFVGTSVEMNKYLHRIDTLLEVPAHGHFVSIEPLLEPLSLTLDMWQYGLSLDWIIVGAESGKNRRVFDVQWARDIRDWCKKMHVPFMYKQGSALYSGKKRELDGRTWDETPYFEDYLLKVQS